MTRGSGRQGFGKLKVTDHPVFRDLLAGEAKSLRKSAKPMTFPAGATIQVGGRVDRRCFVVVDGIVEVTDASSVVECGPGGVFGDAGSYGRELPGTATARTQVRTFMIPSLVMASLTNSNSSLALRLSMMAGDSISLAS